MGKSLALFFIFLFCMQNPEASLRSHQELYKSKSQEMKKLEKNLSHLENKLGSKNQRYIKLEKRKRWIELESSELQDVLTSLQKNLEEKYSRNQKVLEGLILSSIENSEVEDMLSHEIFQTQLLGNMKALEVDLARASKIQKRISVLRNRLFEYSDLQQEIVSILNNLEKEKEEVNHQYLTVEKEEKSLLKKIKEYMLKESESLFSLPLKIAAQVKKGFDGLLYKAQKGEPVLASASGVIAYSGLLSTYGNVLIIDHGKELHSVLVGDFEAIVKKGQKVQKGELVAKALNKLDGKIEFDIRKKSVTQKLTKYINKKLLASK